MDGRSSHTETHHVDQPHFLALSDCVSAELARSSSTSVSRSVVSTSSTLETHLCDEVVDELRRFAPRRTHVLACMRHTPRAFTSVRHECPCHGRRPKERSCFVPTRSRMRKLPSGTLTLSADTGVAFAGDSVCGVCCGSTTCAVQFNIYEELHMHSSDCRVRTSAALLLVSCVCCCCAVSCACCRSATSAASALVSTSSAVSVTASLAALFGSSPTILNVQTHRAVRDCRMACMHEHKKRTRRGRRRAPSPRDRRSRSRRAPLPQRALAQSVAARPPMLQQRARPLRSSSWFVLVSR